MFKIKIIYALTGLVVFLILADIVIPLLNQPDEIVPDPVLSVREIEEIIADVFENHGIHEDWINRRAISDQENDSLLAVHRVKIPEAIPMPVLLSDINGRFADLPVNVTSTEMTINGRTLLKIFSGGFQKYQASLNYDNTLQRDIFSLSFIIDGVEKLSPAERMNLLAVPFPMTFELRSLEQSETLISEINNSNKEYAVIVSMDNGADRYNLSSSYQRSQLRNSIINLVRDFKTASSFFYDPNSELRQSTIFNFVKDEFRRRGRILRNKSDYINLAGDNLNDRLSLLRFHCSSYTPGEIKVFSAGAENFMQLMQVLIDVKNKGNKFIGLREVY